jgi:D-amino-acid dehydrogenase
MPNNDVLVVGAGLAGLTTAVELTQRGYSVAVVEGSGVGGGASRGNAGQIPIGAAGPMNSFGWVREGVVGLLDPTSAFYVHPAKITKYWRYLIGFVKNSAPGTVDAGQAAIDGLTRRTAQAVEKLQSEGIGTDLSRGAYFYMFDSQASAEHGWNAAQQFRWRGFDDEIGPIQSANELAVHAPILTHSAARCGYTQTAGWWGNPSVFVDQAERWLRDHGVPIEVIGDIQAIETKPNHVAVTSVTGARRTADRVVICAGVKSGPLLERLGIRSGIYAGRGYSFTVDCEEAPPGPILFRDAHFSLLPLNDSQIRIAGTMELGAGNNDQKSADRRVAAIRKKAEEYLSRVDWNSQTDMWSGDRPMTSDSLPLIGALTRDRRVLVNTGHNMLGFGLSPSSALLVADLLEANTAGPSRFSPERFTRRGFR